MGPRDFLSDDNNAPSISQPEGRDYLMDEPKESFGESLAYALPRMGVDASQGVVDFAMNIPDYLEKAKTEVPAFFAPIRKDPIHFAGQLLAGANEGINSLAQLPLNAAQYGANRLNLLPQSVPNAISKITPEDTTQAINALFGKPKYPGEALGRGLASNIALAPGLKSATAVLTRTPKTIAKNIMKPHDFLESRASQGFKQVGSEVDKRGINGFSINDPKVLKDIHKYFPQTDQAKDLIKKARAGDYHALRKIQSDLYTEGKKNLASDLEVERARGKVRMEKRDKINKSIQEGLEQKGHKDLSNILNQSRSDYRTLQNVYYNENIPNALQNMVNKDIRKIPDNLINILREDSNLMRRFKNFHPDLQSQINQYLIKKHTINFLKNPFTLGGAAGLGLGYYGASKYGSEK